MIPDPVTWGHAVMLAGLLAGLYALWQASIWLRQRGFIDGTPQYARARDGRRFAVWSLAAAILLYALGCLTRLSELPIA